MHSSIYPVLAAQTRLPFYLSGAGVSDPEYHVTRPEGLVSSQILFTRRGTGILRIDGRILPQTPGSLFFLTPGVPHEYYPESGEWETAWVVFRGAHIREMIAEMGFGAWHEKSGVDLSGCERIFSRIMSAAADPLSGGERCSMLVYEYLLEVRALLLCGRFTGGWAYRPGGALHGREFQPGYHAGRASRVVQRFGTALLQGVPAAVQHAAYGIPRIAPGVRGKAPVKLHGSLRHRNSRHDRLQHPHLLRNGVPPL